MVEMDRYIVDDVVKRDKIVADIKRCRIGKNEILELTKDSRISEAFFGIGEVEKKNKEDWDNSYLDELSLVAVSEMFNKDYLLYLSEVAKYITNKNQKKEKNAKLIKGVVIIAIVLLFLVCAILFVTSKARKENTQLSVNSIALAENTYLCLVKVLS